MDLDSIVGICIAGCGGWLYTQGTQAPPSVVPDPAPEADLRPVDRSQLVGVSTSTLVELPQPFVVALLQASTPDLLGDLFPSFLAHYVDHPSLTGDVARFVLVYLLGVCWLAHLINRFDRFRSTRTTSSTWFFPALALQTGLLPGTTRCICKLD